jgi:hypothetical protein
MYIQTVLVLGGVICPPPFNPSPALPLSGEGVGCASSGYGFFKEFSIMFFRFWSRLWHRLHTRKRARRHGDFSASRHARGASSSPPVAASFPPSTAASAALPACCPLCDKQCPFAALRCKHGEAFRVWVLSSAREAEAHPARHPEPK